jgi:MFS family permease
MRKKINDSLKPYGFIIGFGMVSMLMDVVYEGALAVQGPLLASVGASALIVGAVSGLGEATALAGRLFSGPLADRTGRYWMFALLGYIATALAVPAMGFAGSLIGVSLLIVFERFGKSLRTPSRDAMLSHAAAAVGRGKGFALHEVLDQLGAIAGPLLVAALLSATGNDYRVALGVLVIPGSLAIYVLLRLRRRVPDPRIYEEKCISPSKKEISDSEARAAKNQASSLPRIFWLYACACAIMLAGVATFGVLSYHMVSAGLASDALVPMLYAIAMGVDAVFAALTGVLYDRLGTKVLLALPFICAAIPLFAYADDIAVVAAGVVLWGASLGIQESTMRAAVSNMVETQLRATAYGMFSILVGAGSLIGGVVAGGLYTISTPLLAGYACVIEAIAFVLLAHAIRCSHKNPEQR